jgi:hypothetical protein
MPPNKAANVAANPEADWEEIQPFTTPIDLEPGDEIVAGYLGGNVVDVPGVDDDGNPEVRATMLHEFQAANDSEPFGVWGSAVLDKRLTDAPTGATVKVLYQGKREIPGGRTARQYRVWIDRNAAL